MKRRLALCTLFSASFSLLRDGVTKTLLTGHDPFSKKSSLEEKIGQLLMVGITKEELSEQEIAFFQSCFIGNFILFKRNSKTSEQLTKLTKTLRQVTSSRWPLMIAVDEEGGKVSRLPLGIEKAPSPKEIVDENNLSKAFSWAKKTALQMKSLGLNTNLAPVVEPQLSRGRSFSNDPQIIERYAKASCEGYLTENIPFTLKHFPGLGALTTDTHLGVGTINFSLEELYQKNIQVFQHLIQDLPNERFMVMVNHVIYPAFDSKPACLSQRLINGYLRKELGFDGVVITDDLEMKALEAVGKPGELAIEALKAGADLLLVCHNIEIQKDIYQEILSAVKSDRLPVSRIDEALDRISKLKELLKR